jgi:16S rRNA (cytidine1402-2'-O)-methyltransferase
MLSVCATPIGNLGDISSRLEKTLRDADLILAEDTRKSRKILSYLNIKKPLANILSYNDFSNPKKVDSIIKELCSGKNAALVSEAGMPAIQDPGYKIIKLCIENDINITVIPGPNAALAALVLSGLPTDSFLFAGFLPKKTAKLKEKLFELKNLPYTLIFYESPLRTFSLLELLQEIIGDRNCCIAREITKMHEEIIRGKISEILNILAGKAAANGINDTVSDNISASFKSSKQTQKTVKLKGEIVLVVEGSRKDAVLPDNANNDIPSPDSAAIKKEFEKLLQKNISRKEVFKILKDKYGIKRQTLYNITLKKII